jgi:hypothetical protein
MSSLAARVSVKHLTESCTNSNFTNSNKTSFSSLSLSFQHSTNESSDIDRNFSMLEETSNLKVEKLSKWMRKTTKHFAIDFRSHTGKNQAVLRERVLSTGRATRHGKLRENLISRRRKCQGLSSFTCIVERGNAELGLWRRRSGSFLPSFLSFFLSRLVRRKSSRIACNKKAASKLHARPGRGDKVHFGDHKTLTPASLTSQMR